MATRDPLLSRQLWSAVAEDDAGRVRDLIRRGADVHIQSDLRAQGPGVRVSRSSLLDQAIQHQALHALDALFEAGIRLRSTVGRGTEFSRLVGQARTQPWLDGVRCFLRHRATLTAVSNRDKDGWAAIHNAYAAGKPQSAPAVQLIEILLERPGKWTPEDTALAVYTAVNGGWPVSTIEQWAQTGVPVVAHVQQPGMAKVWNQLSGVTWTSDLGRAWAQRLVDMGCPGPGSEADTRVVAMVRDLVAQRQTPGNATIRPRLRT